MDGADVVAPVQHNLIVLQGGEEAGPWVRHIEFRGLTFICSDRLPEDAWPDEWRSFQGDRPRPKAKETVAREA